MQTSDRNYPLHRTDPSGEEHTREVYLEVPRKCANKSCTVILDETPRRASVGDCIRQFIAGDGGSASADGVGPSAQPGGNRGGIFPRSTTQKVHVADESNADATGQQAVGVTNRWGRVLDLSLIHI